MLIVDTELLVAYLNRNDPDYDGAPSCWSPAQKIFS